MHNNAFSGQTHRFFDIQTAGQGSSASSRQGSPGFMSPMSSSIDFGQNFSSGHSTMARNVHFDAMHSRSFSNGLLPRPSGRENEDLFQLMLSQQDAINNKLGLLASAVTDIQSTQRGILQVLSEYQNKGPRADSAGGHSAPPHGLAYGEGYVPVALNRVHFPDIQYWTLSEYFKHVGSVKGLSEDDDNDDEHKTLWFVTDSNGLRLSGARYNAMRKYAKSIWVFLFSIGEAPDGSWSNASQPAVAYYAKLMTERFEELQWCAEDYKCHRIAYIDYNSWYCRYSGKRSKGGRKRSQRDENNPQNGQNQSKRRKVADAASLPDIPDAASTSGPSSTVERLVIQTRVLASNAVPGPGSPSTSPRPAGPPASAVSHGQSCAPQASSSSFMGNGQRWSGPSTAVAGATSSTLQTSDTPRSSASSRQQTGPSDAMGTAPSRAQSLDPAGNEFTPPPGPSAPSAAPSATSSGTTPASNCDGPSAERRTDAESPVASLPGTAPELDLSGRPAAPPAQSPPTTAAAAALSGAAPHSSRTQAVMQQQAVNTAATGAAAGQPPVPRSDFDCTAAAAPGILPTSYRAQPIPTHPPRPGTANATAPATEPAGPRAAPPPGASATAAASSAPALSSGPAISSVSTTVRPRAPPHVGAPSAAALLRIEVRPLGLDAATNTAADTFNAAAKHKSSLPKGLQPKTIPEKDHTCRRSKAATRTIESIIKNTFIDKCASDGVKALQSKFVPYWNTVIADPLLLQPFLDQFRGSGTDAPASSSTAPSSSLAAGSEGAGEGTSAEASTSVGQTVGVP